VQVVRYALTTIVEMRRNPRERASALRARHGIGPTI
jgi:hypothetical protein